jgi:hypothetical protein
MNNTIVSITVASPLHLRGEVSLIETEYDFLEPLAVFGKTGQNKGNAGNSFRGVGWLAPT